MTDWDRLRGEPLADHVGPFPRRPFLEACSDALGKTPLVVVTDGAGLAVEVWGGVGRAAGAGHVTDYHSPLGSDLGGLPEAIADSVGRIPLMLDSLPGEVAGPLDSAFTAAGRIVTRMPDEESCQVLDLSVAGPDSWEGILGSKERHEVRRKRRRYEKARGSISTDKGRDYIEAFLTLHRSAPGDKGEFMTDRMEDLFRRLVDLPGSRIDVLHDSDEVLAAAFGFDDEDGYYLYNSAFAPSAADLSPGIVLVDQMITNAVRRGLRRFDFLKGDEEYKRRLGAIPRPLYRLEVAA